MSSKDADLKAKLLAMRSLPRVQECPYCGLVMSHREAAEQGACNECYGDVYDPAGMTYVTKTGKVLTESDIYDLAQEAERGYDVSLLVGKSRR